MKWPKNGFWPLKNIHGYTNLNHLKFHLARLMNSNLGFNQLLHTTILLDFGLSRCWWWTWCCRLLLLPLCSICQLHRSLSGMASSQVILQEDGGKLPNQARSLSFQDVPRPESVSVMPDSLFPDHCA